MEQKIDEEHEQDKKHCGSHDHQPKIANADRKGGRRRPLAEFAGDRAELGFAPGRQNQRLGGSAHDRASHEHQIAGKAVSCAASVTAGAASFSAG